MSRFLQGDGYPVLTRYNASNSLQETVNLPYVRDDGSSSYVRINFKEYPEDSLRQHQLLSGNIAEDAPLGKKVIIQIKYPSLTATELKSLYQCIFNQRNNTGHYLKLKPRNDYNESGTDYKVVFKGDFPVESNNVFTHNVMLEFHGTELIANSMVFKIPPIIPD